MEDITDDYDFSLPDQTCDGPKYLFESLFATICQQFTCDSGKSTLIPSPSLYEAKELLPLNVVTMKKKQKRFGRCVKEYSTYDISLANLLNGQHVLEIEVNKSEYNLQSSYTCTASSLKWKTGGRIIDIIEGCLRFFFHIKITCEFGKLTERTIEYQSFMSALKERKLDMNHHFIREIKDAKQVLCVIRNVMTTSDKAEIKCTIQKGGIIHLSEKVNWFFRMYNAFEAKTSKVKDMVIEKGTALAYDVWELRVDVESGKITPVMMAQNSGGFFKGDFQKIENYPVEKFHWIKDDRKMEKYSVEKYHYIKDNQKMETYSFEKYYCITDRQNIHSNMNRSDKPNEGDPPPPNDDEVKMAKTLQDLKNLLKPIHNGTEADSPCIKIPLLKLMTCYSDVMAISKILSKAEDSCLNEDKDTIDKQFINKSTMWSILKFVGVQTEERRVLYEKEANPILIALLFMIDAILELENYEFDIIHRCDEPQRKSLSKIFESAVASSMPISIDVDMSSVLKEPVISFLKQKKFEVCNDSIQPPETMTSNVNCIFCVLYCLS